MFVSRKKHILTRVIMGGAVCNLLFETAEAAQRFYMRRAYSLMPDMLETAMWRNQIGLSVAKLICMMVLFALAAKTLRHIEALVEKDDIVEMAKLQHEAAKESISSLSAYSIGQLLQIWAAIFIGAELVYDFTAVVYRDFIGALSAVFDMTDAGMAQAFVDFYNSTHGFKYMGMLVAVILGVFVTGVFLRDNILKLSAFFVAFCFTLAFFVFKMDTITLNDHIIGIVWTSVIFHLTQTIGLGAMAVYMSRKYRGL